MLRTRLVVGLALVMLLTMGVATTQGHGKRLEIRGADVSSLAKSEDFGGVYRNERGRRGDALRILRDHGLNWIRLRAFVDPADGYHDTREL
jgi:arabinogalactan endo-1,4-beta-galactosidase